MNFSDLVRAMEIRSEYEEIAEDVYIVDLYKVLTPNTASHKIKWIDKKIPPEIDQKLTDLSYQYLQYYNQHLSSIYTPSETQIEFEEEMHHG